MKRIHPVNLQTRVTIERFVILNDSPNKPGKNDGI